MAAFLEFSNYEKYTSARLDRGNFSKYNSVVFIFKGAAFP